MKFDVVVGNPPYNNDIYLKFVETGNDLASTCSVFITPAKWQAKGGKLNEQFRQNIVPYMKKIVYYPCAQEVFDIRNLDGISYYVIDKNIHNKKEIKNISLRQKLFNNEAEREIDEQLNNNAYSIIKKLGIYNSIADKLNLLQSPFGINKDERGKKEYSDGLVLLMAGEDNRGYVSRKLIKKSSDFVDKYKLAINTMMGNGYYDMNGQTLGVNRTYIYEPCVVTPHPFLCLMKFDTKNEATSLQSYLDTRLIRFLIITACISQNNTSYENWRFVPDPGAFDHIFTDEELYKKYNLTPEEINIIESVIKERK